MFRAMVLAAQGVFYNAFCESHTVNPCASQASVTHLSLPVLCYMVSPKTCHRFVGHLEEEAVIT